MHKIQALSGDTPSTKRAKNLEAVFRAINPLSTFRYLGAEPFQWPSGRWFGCFVHFGVPSLNPDVARSKARAERAWDTTVGLISADSEDAFAGTKLVFHVRSPRFNLLNAPKGITGAKAMVIFVHAWHVYHGPTVVSGNRLMGFELGSLDSIAALAIQGLASGIPVTIVNFDTFRLFFGGDGAWKRPLNHFKRSLLIKIDEKLFDEVAKLGRREYPNGQPSSSKLCFKTAKEYRGVVGEKQFNIEAEEGALPE